MKQSNIYLLSYGFLFIALGNEVAEQYLLTFLCYGASMILVVLRMMKKQNYNFLTLDSLIFISVQTVLSYLLGINVSLALMLIIYNTILFSSLQAESQKCKKSVSLWILSSLSVLIAFIFIAQKLFSLLLHCSLMTAYGYIPEIVLLMLPQIIIILSIVKKADLAFLPLRASHN